MFCGNKQFAIPKFAIPKNTALRLGLDTGQLLHHWNSALWNSQLRNGEHELCFVCVLQLCDNVM